MTSAMERGKKQLHVSVRYFVYIGKPINWIPGIVVVISPAFFISKDIPARHDT
jgi:hypothetical protein